jgi:hypothetical protein
VRSVPSAGSQPRLPGGFAHLVWRLCDGPGEMTTGGGAGGAGHPRRRARPLLLVDVPLMGGLLYLRAAYQARYLSRPAPGRTGAAD